MKYIEKINLNDQDFVFIPPAATAEQIGGIKAENAIDENVELKIDEQGKLYAPQYPDFSGKLDKNQGGNNADKVFVINAEGNLEPTEFKGGSDNRLIANVEKVENANINDSYQAKIENLKLYGKSTQGADPSPTNEQPITAISQFDGAPTGDNIFNPNSTDTVSSGVYSAIIVNPLKAQITVSITDNDTSVDITGINLGVSGNAEYFDDLFWMIANNANVRTKTTNSKCIIYYPKTQETLQKLLQRFNIKVEFRATATPYTPYVAQPFTYTPTNPMYSTLDGNINDYIDIEKGIENYYLGIDNEVNQKSWNIASQNDNFIKFEFANIYDNINLNVNIPVICNMFNQITVADGDSLTKEGIAKGGSSFIFQVVLNKNRGILTVEDFKTFIQEMIIVYPLATPTKIPINPEKLTVLRNLYTYKGITNFLCNAPISFNYEQSVDLVIKDLLNKIQTTGANLLYLNSK